VSYASEIDASGTIENRRFDLVLGHRLISGRSKPGAKRVRRSGGRSQEAVRQDKEIRVSKSRPVEEMAAGDTTVGSTPIRSFDLVNGLVTDETANPTERPKNSIKSDFKLSHSNVTVACDIGIQCDVTRRTQSLSNFPDRKPATQQFLILTRCRSNLLFCKVPLGFPST
jgi:hypothetical protein